MKNEAGSDSPSTRGAEMDYSDTMPRGWSAWFGGPNVRVGPRIAPITVALNGPDAAHDSDSALSSEAILSKQLEEEAGSAIKYRTCSWQKTAALLFSEYICLAIMSFPWSYSYLGLVPGLILTVVQALVVLYTSIILWEFCLRHPEVRDVCDIGQMLFWGQKWVWYFTAVMFILNNTFIQGLHILTGAKYINTMIGDNPTDVACQTVSFGAIVTVISWLASLPRTFDLLAKLGTGSASFTLISVILATIFAGIQAHPAGYTEALGDPTVTAVTLPSLTFVNGLNAFLNISYTFIGQITLPSFIAEMRDPRDFPKALWACTILEILTFSIVGGVMYGYIGNQYITAPAFGSLETLYKKISFSFMIPTIIFLGVLYASVSARFVFFRIFEHSRHKNEHTLIGWTTWASILLATWIVAFIIANSIPFFSSLLSLMSSLFDSFFGFIFWGVAYFRMRKVDGHMPFVHDRSPRALLEGALNVILIMVGIFFLTAGTYATVQGIIDEYAAGGVGSAFQCASDGI
ncbi:amino-acid permease [Xylariaceae sp. FL0804]|nr:amino-acid permease [Xylariaceae sp. FL0804]